MAESMRFGLRSICFAVPIGAAVFSARASADTMFPASYFGGNLPACDSSIAKSAVLYSFQNGNDPAMTHIADLTDAKSTDLTDAQRADLRTMGVQFSATPPKRVDCEAKATFDNGSAPVSFGYWFVPLSGDRVFLGTVIMNTSR